MQFLRNLLKTTAPQTAFALVAVMLAAAVVVPAQQTSRPAGTQQQSDQGRRYGQAGFVGEPINLNVVNADIRDILSYITEQYGVNFIIDRSVKATPVTVNLSDVPWNIALEAILQSQGLGIDVQGSILRLADAKILADEQSIRAQIENARLDNAPLYTEIIQLNYARASGTLGTAAGNSGGFSGGTVGGPAGGGGGDSTGGGGDSGIMPIIRKRLSRRGTVEVDGRGNRLIVTDVRQNIDAMRQLVALLDRPEPQVEIETRIVIASRNFLREIGVQLGLDVANPFGRGGTLGGQTGRANDNPPTASFGLTTGIFGTAQLTAALNLAETNGQSKTIATPRVTALNNRPAQIESGSQIPVTTVQEGSGTGGGRGVSVFTTTFVNVPLRLSVTPQITEAGTVLLRLVVENNTVNRTLAAGLGGTPGIDTQRMQTEVLVPDGGTTVVGGVLVDTESESRSKTPGLGNLPLVGNLFKNRSKQRNTSEILFFITPRIYRPDFQGNPTSGKVGDSTRSTTILQPVPLGNPSSNSNDPTTQPQPNTTAPNPLFAQPNTGKAPEGTPANPQRPQ